MDGIAITTDETVDLGSVNEILALEESMPGVLLDIDVEPLLPQWMCGNGHFEQNCHKNMLDKVRKEGF